MIAYVEAEGIDASGARVAESDIKRRRDRAMRPFVRGLRSHLPCDRVKA